MMRAWVWVIVIGLFASDAQGATSGPWPAATGLTAVRWNSKPTVWRRLSMSGFYRKQATRPVSA